VKKLDDIESPLAALILSHEGLGFLKAISHLLLGQTGLFAGLQEECRVLGGDRQSMLEVHPTVKPVQMVAEAILDCSRPQGVPNLEKLP
jgi:hypothetical protein